MSRRTSLRVLRTAAIAVVAAIGLSSCSAYDLPLPGGADTGDNPMTVHVKFRDVLDLVPQSTVKVDDVTVGKVTDIKLDGYIADVTLKLPRSVDLPDNARAEIRQTSLLGEKFVSLSKPSDPSGHLGPGDVIGLEDTGRNPEVEEVFEALALILNGGGVGQLKTISEELNLAFGGREESVRSIIQQLGSFMGQLDTNKESIVTALDNLNRLSLEIRRQDSTIKQTLDDMPRVLQSVDSQRQDLVKMLQALSRLSSVGVRVIQASKASTIDSLRNLAPVLEQFAKAGQNFPRSLSVFLTYPFVDEAVGRDPQVARNLHMGDFVNLSVNLNLDLFNLPNVPGLAPGVSLADVLADCAKTPLNGICAQLKSVVSPTALQGACKLLPVLCQGPVGTGNGGGGVQIPGIGGVPNPLSGTSTPKSGGLLGLGRAAPAYDAHAQEDPFLLSGTGYDPALGTLLMQGVAVQ